jgi:hypothetical protein
MLILIIMATGSRFRVLSQQKGDFSWFCRYGRGWSLLFLFLIRTLSVSFEVPTCLCTASLVLSYGIVRNVATFTATIAHSQHTWRCHPCRSQLNRALFGVSFTRYLVYRTDRSMIFPAGWAGFSTFCDKGTPNLAYRLPRPPCFREGKFRRALSPARSISRNPSTREFYIQENFDERDNL